MTQTSYKFKYKNSHFVRNERCSLSFSSDSLGELHVLWHDGDSLGVDGAEVGVFEKSDHVGFSGFLEGKDGR